MAANPTTVSALSPDTTGIVEGSTVKIEPKRICWVAPVVA